MQLYFRNSLGQERLIGKELNIDECMKKIQSVLELHNFKSYYTRTWQEPDGRLMIDVGSHTEFFIIEGATMQEFTRGGGRKWLRE